MTGGDLGENSSPQSFSSAVRPPPRLFLFSSLLVRDLPNLGKLWKSEASRFLVAGERPLLASVLLTF
jgi:hypothetical protein